MPTVEPMSARRPTLRAPSVKPPRRQAPAPIDYPESDGKPMAETPIHWHATVDFASPLLRRYAARPDAYVGSDMLMYYEEGNIGKAVSPDVFVAFGPSREPQRDTWRVWEEGKAADFILEVTSKTTRRKDDEFKADLYARLGVTEYWQFDPTEDYLHPALKGQRIRPDGTYEAIGLEQRDGGLFGWSAVLGLELRPAGETLRLFDPKLGDYLPTLAESEARRDAANAERDAAKSEAGAVKAKLDRAEARLDAAEKACRAEAEARREEVAARRAAEARIAELERRLAEGD